MAQVDDSGTADILKSPVVVPAVVRVTSTPKVTEKGLVLGANGSVAIPEKAAAVNGPSEPMR